jgi:hypothetical protein
LGSRRLKSKKTSNFLRKNFSFLNFWNFRSGRRKLTSNDFVGEVARAVGTIAERLVGGLAAAAEPDGSAPGKTEFISAGIYDFKIAFDKYWPIISESNLGWHFFSAGICT